MIATTDIQDICNQQQGYAKHSYGCAGEVQKALPLVICEALKPRESRKMIHVETDCLTLSLSPRTKWNLM